VFTYGGNDVPDWTVRAQQLMGRLDPSVRIPAHAKLDDEFEYWKCPTCSEWINLEESDCAVLYGREVDMIRTTSCQRCRFLQCWGTPHSCKCYCHDTKWKQRMIDLFRDVRDAIHVAGVASITHLRPVGGTTQHWMEGHR